MGTFSTKKIMALMLGSSLLVSSFTSVAFADDITSKYQATLTFDTFTESSDTSTVSSEISSNKAFLSQSALNLTDQNLAEVKASTYGKAADDKAIHFYRTSTSTADNSLCLDLSGDKATAVGEYTEIEMYMAWDADSVGSKGVIGFYKWDDALVAAGKNAGTGECQTANDGISGNKLFSVKDNGVLYVMGKDTGYTLPAGKWYKFNLIIRGGENAYAASGSGEMDYYSQYPNTEATNTNRYWFYVDNQPIVEDQIFTPYGSLGKIDNGWRKAYTNFIGIYKIRPDIRTSDKGVTSGVWMDDITLRQGLAEKPSFSSAVFEVKDNASEDSVAKLYDGASIAGVQYVDERVNLSDMKFCSADIAIDKTNLASGEEALLWGNIDGEKISGMLKNASELRYNKTFEDESTKQDLGVSGSSATKSLSKAELAGKTDGYMLVSTNTTQPWTDAEHISQNLGCSNTGFIPYTFECSLYNDNVKETAVSLIAGGKWNTFKLNGSNNTIVDPKQSTIGRYADGQWDNYAFTVYPAANKMEIYRNGNLIKTLAFDRGNSVNTLERIKLVTKFYSEGEGSDTTKNYMAATSAYDDFKFYVGSRPSVSAPVSVTSDNLTVGKKVIFVPDLYTAYNKFFSALNIENADLDNVKVYTDDTFATENTGKIEQGNVLVIPRNTGDEVTYDYYYLTIGTPADTAITSTGFDATVGTHENVKTKIDFYKPVSSCTTMYIAQYKNGRLEKVDSVPISAVDIAGHNGTDYEYPYVYETDSYDITIEDGCTVKSFIWIDDNIFPVANVKSIIE